MAGGVGFFSLEMSAEQLATRIIAEQASVSSSDIRRGKIAHDDFHPHQRGSRLRCSAAALLSTRPVASRSRS